MPMSTATSHVRFSSRSVYVPTGPPQALLSTVG
jgi:hypothetical protein